MITVVDYGVGNLFSLKSSLAFLGVDAQVTGDAAQIEAADAVILPGVGAFGDAADKLCETGLDQVLCRLAGEGKPLLGICLGMQLLFDKSYEHGEHAGLGLIPGEVRPLREKLGEEYLVPHIGWNGISFRGEPCPLFEDIEEGDYVYFVHSFYATDCAEHTVAVTDYGMDVTAVVQRGNVFGCQFHPEKSGAVGLRILQAFCRYAGQEGSA